MTITIVWSIAWAIALAYSIKTALNREHGEARFATWFSNESITLGILGTLVGFILLGYDWVSVAVPTTDQLVKDLIICLVTSGEGWIAHAVLEGIFTYKAPKETDEMDLMVEGARRFKEEVMAASTHVTAVFNAMQQITSLPSLAAKFDELVQSSQELEKVQEVLTGLTTALNELLKLNTAGNFISGIATNLNQLTNVDSTKIGGVADELGKLAGVDLTSLDQQGAILAGFSDQAKVTVDNCQPLTGLPATLGQVKDAAVSLNDGTKALEKLDGAAASLPQQLQPIQANVIPLLDQLVQALRTVSQQSDVQVQVFADVDPVLRRIEELNQKLGQVQSGAIRIDVGEALLGLGQVNTALQETLEALRQAQAAGGGRAF